MKTWMVRAGKGGKFYERFESEGIVAIGWYGAGDLSAASTREKMVELIRQAYPEYPNQKILITAGQLFRFAHEFKNGDRVVTYDSGARSYLCGTLMGEYRFHADVDDEVFLNTRAVTWSHEKPRDDLSVSAQNSLGAISTIFSIDEEYSAELWNEHLPNATDFGSDKALLDDKVALGRPSLSDVEDQSGEIIKDKISGFDWEQMQELVAALLRAMGYKTSISSRGPDRGRDIVASPDGFGFQDPRIVVEVKHRPKHRMGAQEIRSFLGGRRSGDKGLFVSTGGFSKDAHYEADRSNIPITLMDFEDLVEAIMDHYEHFDDEARQLLPLKPVYWIVD